MDSSPQENNENKEQQSQQPPGKIDVLIADDNMSAALSLFGAPDTRIDYDYVVELLNQKGIVFGIDLPLLHRWVEQMQKGVAEPKTIIAKGLPMSEGSPALLERLVKEPPPVSIDAEGRADYRNIQRYVVVEKGDLLVRLKPAVQGKDGYNIFGESIPATAHEEITLNAGKNIQVMHTGDDSLEYYSLIHGVLVTDESSIDVSSVLIIEGDVGLTSGNITYDGSATIGGNIDRGSTVHVQGDLDVTGTVEAGHIHVGKNMNVKSGIITKQEGVIRVGGNLHAVFLDNSKVIVEKSITVDRSISASRIICYQNIDLPSKGSAISGGEVYTFGSVIGDFIGNKMESITKIYLGVHYHNIESFNASIKDLERVDREYLKLTEQIQKIKIYVQRTRGNITLKRKVEFRLVFNEFKEKQEQKQRLEKQIQDLKENRYNQSEVNVIAKDTLYPGVEIHYRNRVERITAPLTRVKLRFKPGIEKPAIEAWK